MGLMADMADWSRYNLPAIWAMVKDENVCDGADRVLGWDVLSQDVRDQHERLVAARDNLAEAWPPGKNASAQDFLTHVSKLATSMNDTLTAAEDTRVGLQGIMNAIATAQSTLSPIVRQRQATSTDFIPRFVDHAEDDYDRAGQQAMRVAEAAILDHGTQIRAPQLYILSAESGEITTDLPEPGKGGFGTSGSGGGSLAAVPVPVPVPHPSAAGFTGSGDGGLGLAGVLPLSPSTPPALGGMAPPLPGVTPSAGGLVGGISAVGLPGVVIGGGAFGPTAAGGFGSWMPAAAAAGRPVSVRRGLPSGATIGAQESEGGLGGRGFGGRGFGGRGVGGRGVGGQGYGGREPLAGGSAGRGAAGRGSPAGGSGGRGRRSAAADDKMISGEADLRWGVRSGVEPVIEPDTTPVRHDPGPGVIGFGA
jgi:hypothetical protein